jgi:hypothetical protein
MYIMFILLFKNNYFLSLPQIRGCLSELALLQVLLADSDYYVFQNTLPMFHDNHLSQMYKYHWKR